MAGVECSTNRRRDGRRLDLIAATEHDKFVAQDYQRFKKAGLTTVRSGFRWHLIEKRAGRYDLSSAVSHVRAAQQAGVQVIWDLCHYGWPDDLDIFKPPFVDRLAAFSRKVARILADEIDGVPFYCPVNEISFLSWAGGDAGHLNPYAEGRSFELKVQLVRAAIASIEAIWDVDPRARFVHVEPAVNIVLNPALPETDAEARGYHEAQYQAWDMLGGQMWPLIGGHPKYLDIVGLNFYPGNQWAYKGEVLHRRDPRYRPLRSILQDNYQRYGRPMFISETGAESDDRAPWLRYVTSEVGAARGAGVPVEGICLYPILDYPGWEDDRDCPSGLWGRANALGERKIYAPLARELARHQAILQPDITRL